MTKKVIKNIIKINICLIFILKAPRFLIESILNIILIRQHGLVKKIIYLNKWAIDKANLRKTIIKYKRKLKN